MINMVGPDIRQCRIIRPDFSFCQIIRPDIWHIRQATDIRHPASGKKYQIRPNPISNTNLIFTILISLWRGGGRKPPLTTLMIKRQYIS